METKKNAFPVINFVGSNNQNINIVTGQNEIEELKRKNTELEKALKKARVKIKSLCLVIMDE